MRRHLALFLARIQGVLWVLQHQGPQFLGARNFEK